MRRNPLALAMGQVVVAEARELPALAVRNFQGGNERC